jgi:hypothetical protein
VSKYIFLNAFNILLNKNITHTKEVKKKKKKATPNKYTSNYVSKDTHSHDPSTSRPTRLTKRPSHLEGYV